MSKHILKFLSKLSSYIQMQTLQQSCLNLLKNFDKKTDQGVVYPDLLDGNVSTPPPEKFREKARF